MSPGDLSYVRESEELMRELREVSRRAIEKCRKKNIREWNRIKGEVKDSLSDFLWKKMKRNPVIIPIIMGTLRKSGDGLANAT